MKISHEDFVSIRAWIYRNARPLDLARWKYKFEGASADGVIEARSAYQNEDGGFGHALEADAWNPNSSPLQTSTAIESIEEVKGLDYNHPMIVGILQYLFHQQDFTMGRWANTVVSNDDFPHAPWWNGTPDDRQRYEYNPTAILVGFILKYALPDSILHQRGLELAKELAMLHKSTVVQEMHPLLCLEFLYRRIEEVGYADEPWFIGAKTKLLEDIHALILNDLDRWNEYACLPTVFITTPDHPLYPALKIETDKDIQRKLASRNNDGIWDISWNWVDYPEAFAISSNWWKADLVLRNLQLFKNFNLL
ncbi:MAG: hypothetical protein E4G74_03095 [Erysipelotrichales bacterium]|nr:MAG: hypothetical protein E4G74_03095 [Erysipelotrichales bacterium]